MKLEKIIEEWEKDSKIDDKDLEGTTVKTSILHAKYLNIMTKSRLSARALDIERDKLFKNKWLYYNGKLTKEKIEEYAWAYDPFDGMSKPLKSDMDMWYKTDPELVAVDTKIAVLKEKINYLEEVISTLRWRHSSIRNILDWKKFQAGY